MSYSIKKEDDSFCVYDNESGEKKGTYTTRHEAIQQMRSLLKTEGKTEEENPDKKEEE